MSRHCLSPERAYVNEFLGLKCAPDLLTAKLFPDSKEVSESQGCFYAIRNHILPHIKMTEADSDIVVVVPGDGKQPRTGALIAFRSRWTVFSIDPNLDKSLRVERRDKKFGTVLRHNIFAERLIAHKRKIEDDSIDTTLFAHTILVMCHSHARIEDSINSLSFNRLHCVVMPCCVSQNLPQTPNVEYTDIAVWSPKNIVKVYLDVQRS